MAAKGSVTPPNTLAGNPTLAHGNWQDGAIEKNDALMRVGVIEVGSRAVRLLVADTSETGGMEIRNTDVEDSRIMESVHRGDVAIRGELQQVFEVATRFREKALRFGAERVCVFGTEAIRQVADLEVFRASPLATVFDEILDDRTEALCSLLSGLMGLPAVRKKGGRVLVIDQGAGSTELAAGKYGPPIELVDFASLKLGGNTLLKLLRDHRLNFIEFRSAVNSILDECAIPAGDFDQVIIQGTVATKCAWLIERKNKQEKYNPRRVHGNRVPLSRLELFLIPYLEKLTRTGWAKFQDMVNPGEPAGDAGERVASGIVPLVYFLKRLKKHDFLVSAHGTRHGMAWLLANRSAANDGL